MAAVSGRPLWRQRETLAGRGLLRALLAELLPWAAAAPIVRDGAGRPALAGLPEVGISLSHDGGTVAAAVAPGRRVGVDVQLPPDEVSDGMLRRCLHERAGQVAALPPAARLHEFAWIWSVQEACVKAEGTGIAGRPWAIDVPVRPRHGRWRDLTWMSLRDRTSTPVSCAFGDLLC
ncbi:4'-phosphopantetheinyl transferase superfamily protein [Streptomyces sp. SID4948]|nr:4'-phosphopantetheinyl transferase superfamily protein [Streptomyces sp. SID4948]